MGYKITQYHEVLHWKESEHYDPLTKEWGLFTSYINTFLKLKQQTSEFPEYIQTNEEKDHYIEQYFLHEGILLEKDLIEKKPWLEKFVKVSFEFILWQVWSKN